MGRVSVRRTVLALAAGTVSLAAPGSSQTVLRFVEAGETRLAVWSTHGPGPAVVVLHGGPGIGSAYLRRALVPTLGLSFRLYFPDLRGSGASEGTEDLDLLAFAQLVRDLDVVRHALGLDQMVLLGHSFGGLLALQYAADYPERVDRLILVDPDPPTRQLWEEHRDIVAARTSDDVAARLRVLGDSVNNDADPERLTQWFALRLRAYVAEPERQLDLGLQFDARDALNYRTTYAAIRRDLGDWDLQPDLARIEAPTLVISGPKSIFPARAATLLLESIDHAELVLLDRTGHFPFVESPSEFAVVVARFLAAEEAHAR